MKALASLILFLSVSCGGQFTGIETNVPSSRLTQTSYTSPDDSFTVAIPHRLAKDGLKIYEKDITADDFSVSFWDYYGQRYSIIRSNNLSNHWSFESAAALLPLGQALKDSQYITTERGVELRLRFIRKGEGLNTVTELGKGPNGTDLVFRTDLVEADAIFFIGPNLFIVTSSISVDDSSHYTNVLNVVKSDLNKFLYDLKLRGVSRNGCDELIENRFANLEISLTDKEQLNQFHFDAIESADTMPTILSKVEPVYPCEAKKAGLEGEVLMRVLLDEKGVPMKYVVLVSDGLFTTPSINAIMATKFSPAIKNGKPVRMWAIQPYSFKL